MAEFNPTTDKIAVDVKEFTLKKKSEIPFDRYSEPYIITLAIDEQGAKNPAIDFNVLPFPKTRKNETVKPDGQGHLVYGPGSPGEFVVYTVLFMESDNDLRDFGIKMEKIVTSEAVNLGMKALLAAAPTYATAANLLQKLTELIAKQLQNNKDDELYRKNGTLLRDLTPPYDIEKEFETANDFIKATISVLPLKVTREKSRGMRKIVL